MPDSDDYHLPKNAGRIIVEAAALFTIPLLRTDAFVSFCRERGVNVSAKRLALLEQLGWFGPVFRVLDPGDVPCFRLPVKADENWFEKGWAWDTSVPAKGYVVPEANDESQEAYYSIFQLDELSAILWQTTLTVELDWYFRDELEGKAVDWAATAKDWLDLPRRIKGPAHFNRKAAFLCQYISERYYPHTQSDGRIMPVGRASYSDNFMNAYIDEDWHTYVRSWKPEPTASLYGLTPASLRNMYEWLAVDQATRDPIEDWYQLVNFVAVDMKKRLKGDALAAATTRSAALMLRMLYRDLYKEELPIPNEVAGQILIHQPELEVRQDTRRFLEFVANRFHVNPQPRLALFVEGETEKLAIEIIFERYVGSHPGKYGIEIIVLGGVDNATGTKEDMFRAIFRLVDYLHHHQTITYLLLDNERFARKLQAEAKNAKSIHNSERLVTRPDHVQLWEKSFEFDNFSSDELAGALTELADGKASFSATDLESCKAQDEAGAAMKCLYRGRTGSNLERIALTKLLMNEMFSSSTQTKPVRDRPIVVTLDKVASLAIRNPLPTRQKHWVMNQRSEFLGLLRSPKDD